MKKILGILMIAGALVACNNDADDEPTTDTSAVTVDTSGTTIDTTGLNVDTTGTDTTGR